MSTVSGEISAACGARQKRSETARNGEKGLQTLRTDRNAQEAHRVQEVAHGVVDRRRAIDLCVATQRVDVGPAHGLPEGVLEDDLRTAGVIGAIDGSL